MSRSIAGSFDSLVAQGSVCMRVSLPTFSLRNSSTMNFVWSPTAPFTSQRIATSLQSRSPAVQLKSKSTPQPSGLKLKK